MLVYGRGMAGKQIDQAALESRRMRAAALFAKGATQAEVARRLGVSSVSALRWYRAWKAKGRAGLASAGRLGRPAMTSEAQRKAVADALLKGPQAHGWSTEIWTLPRIAEVVKRITGVRYHEGHVWKLLRQMGWSLQRPTTRARERDEGRIARWKRRTWLRVKKTPDPMEPSSSPTKAGFPKAR